MAFLTQKCHQAYQQDNVYAVRLPRRSTFRMNLKMRSVRRMTKDKGKSAWKDKKLKVMMGSLS